MILTMTPHMRAVILDHTTLFGHVAETTQVLGRLLAKVQSLGHKVVVFSTNPISIKNQLQRHNLPNVDLCLTANDLGGEKKGTRAWIRAVGEQFGIPNHRMFYIGDDEQDWREAVNCGTFPLHAKWSKSEH